MKSEEIKATDLNPQQFIAKKIVQISGAVGDEKAINALSGGVDSSTVTMLAHRALGDKLLTYFIDHGLMRQDEPQQISSLFREFGVNVEIIDAKDKFFNALKGITDPEAKREAIVQTFYKDVFGRLVRESGAKHLLQGTILTDVDETLAGIKRQHNVFEQLGIDPEQSFGYKIIEPLIQLRKDGVRKVAVALGLPESIYNRMPFLGPALAGRVIGEVTPERIKTVRQATIITEQELANTPAFQYMAILHADKVTGMRACLPTGKNGNLTAVRQVRDYGSQIEIRCWESIDARTATPTRLHWKILDRLAKRITTEVSGIVSVTYNITPKPPSTMEAV